MTLYIFSAPSMLQNKPIFAFFQILERDGTDIAPPWIWALCWCRCCAFYRDNLQVHRVWRHTQTCGKCHIDVCWAMGSFFQNTTGFEPMFVSAGLLWIEHWRAAPSIARRLHYCCVQVWYGPGVVVESVLGTKCHWPQCFWLVGLWLADSNQTPAPWNVRWTLLAKFARR